MKSLLLRNVIGQNCACKRSVFLHYFREFSWNFYLFFRFFRKMSELSLRDNMSECVDDIENIVKQVRLWDSYQKRSKMIFSKNYRKLIPFCWELPKFGIIFPDHGFSVEPSTSEVGRVADKLSQTVRHEAGGPKAVAWQRYHFWVIINGKAAEIDIDRHFIK